MFVLQEKSLHPFRLLMLYLVGNLGFWNETTFLSYRIRCLTTKSSASGKQQVFEFCKFPTTHSQDHSHSCSRQQFYQVVMFVLQLSVYVRARPMHYLWPQCYCSTCFSLFGAPMGLFTKGKTKAQRTVFHSKQLELIFCWS